jgi:hypothetical protein
MDSDHLKKKKNNWENNLKRLKTCDKYYKLSQRAWNLRLTQNEDLLFQ